MTTFTTTSASTTWTSDIIQLLRALIDDLDAITYTNARLTDIIVVAAHFVAKEINFDYTYTVNIASQTLDPSPDDDFKNFVALKSAGIILNAESRTLAKQAFRVKDGPSEIDTGRVYVYIKGLADTMDENYALAKIAYQAGNLRAFRAILTPYTVPSSITGENFA